MSVIDGATNAVTATVATGTSPEGVAVNTVTNTVYVTNVLSDNVTVINGSNNTVTATVPAQSEPTAVAVDPVTNIVYVADLNNNCDSNGLAVTRNRD